MARVYRRVEVVEMKIEVDETNDSWMTTTRKNNKKKRSEGESKEKSKKKAREVSSRVVDAWLLRYAAGQVHSSRKTAAVVNGPEAPEVGATVVKVEYTIETDEEGNPKDLDGTTITFSDGSSIFGHSSLSGESLEDYLQKGRLEKHFYRWADDGKPRERFRLVLDGEGAGTYIEVFDAEWFENAPSACKRMASRIARAWVRRLEG